MKIPNLGLYTIAFMFFILLAIIGMKMVVNVADPVTRKISASLADTLGSV